jgi:GntR family transcriptional repressor for pyruvate dehydrogenase complex
LATLEGEVRRVADAILEKILDGTWPAGLRLPAEAELGEALGCGRSTVREALRHLADLGVVRSKKGSGATVLDHRVHGRSLGLLGPWLASGRFSRPLPVLTRELLGTRTHLACEGARLAALYAEPGGLDAAWAVVERSRGLESDPAAHTENDLELHRALTIASGVPPAVWMFNALREPLLELSRRFGVALVPPGYAEVMTTLLERCEARDADAAVKLLSAHLASVDALVLEALAPLFAVLERKPPSPRARRPRRRTDR